MNNPLVISLAGVAKAGKDNFYKLLADIYPGAVRLSIGDIIRDDCESLILEKFGIDVFDATPAQKEIIRPILAGYGKAQQDATSGKYFTDMLDRQIESYSTGNVYFVLTDCRYVNEVNWLRSKDDNALVHITRLDKNGKAIKPANEYEANGDTILKNMANYAITWHTNDDHGYQNSFVVNFYSWLKNRKN